MQRLRGGRNEQLLTSSPEVSVKQDARTCIGHLRGHHISQWKCLGPRLATILSRWSNLERKHFL